MAEILLDFLNVLDTVGKFYNFSAAQILREIIFLIFFFLQSQVTILELPVTDVVSDPLRDRDSNVNCAIISIFAKDVSQ